MIKNDVIAHDRFGNEIRIGTEVIYAKYERSSALYLGKVERVTEKTIYISKGWRSRQITKAPIIRDVIVKPKEYVEQKKN